MLKKFVAMVVCASMTIANPAFSASFGKSSGSSSSRSSSSSGSSSGSRSYSSTPSRSNYSTAPSNQSAGMRRSEVTESVRNGTSRQNTPPSYSNNGNNGTYSNNGNNYGNNGGYNNRGYSNSPGYQQPNYQTPQPRNYGTGALVGAGVAGLAAGALVGYMMHKDSSGNTYYTQPNNPNVAYDNQGNRMSSVPQGNYNQQGTVDVNGNVAPVNTANSSNANTPNNSGMFSRNAQAAPAEKSSGMGFLGWLLVLLLIGGAVAFFLSRRKSSGVLGNTRQAGAVLAPTFNTDPRTQLEDEADQIFMDIQKNNRASQINYIQGRVDPQFFDSIRDSVMAESDDKQVVVKSIESEVVDVSQKGSKTVGSVHYRAVMEERKGSDLERQTVNDVWHFVYKDGKWLWSGLEEVEPQINEKLSGGGNDDHYKL